MSKSLGLSGKGLPLEKFMRALIQVPKDQIDKAIKSDKKKRARKKVGPPQPGGNL